MLLSCLLEFNSVLYWPTSYIHRYRFCCFNPIIHTGDIYDKQIVSANKECIFSFYHFFDVYNWHQCPKSLLILRKPINAQIITSSFCATNSRSSLVLKCSSLWPRSKDPVSAQVLPSHPFSCIWFPKTLRQSINGDSPVFLKQEGEKGKGPWRGLGISMVLSAACVRA